MTSGTIFHHDLSELPVNQKEKLCQLLDQNDSWVELGRMMQFSESEIANMKAEAFRLSRSPSHVLLTKWTRYAHVVTELFKLLADMQHFEAMREIQSSVHERYHVWIKQTHSNKPLNLPEHGQSQIFNANARRQEGPPQDRLHENLKHLLNIPEIPIEQLKEATNKWAEENILGKGGFGTVYRGEWISTKVAVKKLEYRASRSSSYKDHLVQSLNEMRHLNNCRHDNILPIYGFSMKDDACLVVYQLMPGGSLDDRLTRRHGQEPLTWPLRWNIAKGTARGLQYLHRYALKPLIHGDIKPANILLDASCEAKIGDFGLSREGHQHDECEEVSRVFGTKPYLPPEFMDDHLFSTKVDVFSFGVVLFEIATGMKSSDKTREPPKKNVFLYNFMAQFDTSLVEHIAMIIDKSTPNDEACFNLCKLMVNLGKQCTNSNPNYRPEMKSVFDELDNFLPVVPAVGIQT